MGLTIRNIRDDEVDTFRAAVMMAFGDDLDVDPDGPARTRALLDLTQVWAAFDGAAIVGTAATIDFGIVVPGGGSLPMAGLTTVMVRPTHRRRGLLRQLMQHHLDDMRTRSYPLSGLWSSEASIYGAGSPPSPTCSRSPTRACCTWRRARSICSTGSTRHAHATCCPRSMGARRRSAPVR